MTETGSPTAQHHRTGPLLWCTLAAALFGASTPASKMLVSGMDAPLLVGLLYAGAALLVLPAVVRGKRPTNVSRANVAPLAGAAVFGGMLGPMLALTALRSAPAGAVSLWLVLETVTTALIGRFLFREHLSSRGVISIVLVVVGSVLLATELQLGMPALFVALACVCWGIDNNLTSVIDAFTPEQIILAKGASTAVVVIPASLLWGAHCSGQQVALALIIGALGYGLSLVLYVAGSQQLGATRSQILFSTAPLFGLIPSWLLLGETITLTHGITVVLLATAQWIVHRETHTHEHTHVPVEHTHLHVHDDEHHVHEHGEMGTVRGWHQHPHRHEAHSHSHAHRPDLHHRHDA